MELNFDTLELKRTFKYYDENIFYPVVDTEKKATRREVEDYLDYLRKQKKQN